MNHAPISRRTLLASTALLSTGGRALAQAAGSANWPNRPIKIVVPGPAGVGGDIFAACSPTVCKTASSNRW